MSRQRERVPETRSQLVVTNLFLSACFACLHYNSALTLLRRYGNMSPTNLLAGQYTMESKQIAV